MLEAAWDGGAGVGVGVGIGAGPLCWSQRNRLRLLAARWGGGMTLKSSSGGGSSGSGSMRTALSDLYLEHLLQNRAKPEVSPGPAPCPAPCPPGLRARFGAARGGGLPAELLGSENPPRALARVWGQGLLAGRRFPPGAALGPSRRMDAGASPREASWVWPMLVVCVFYGSTPAGCFQKIKQIAFGSGSCCEELSHPSACLAACGAGINRQRQRGVEDAGAGLQLPAVTEAWCRQG